MNERETIVAKKLESDGWEVLHNGAPDLIAWKTDSNNRIIDHKHIEVKSPEDKLSPEQKKHNKILAATGSKCEIWTVDLTYNEPNITKILGHPTITSDERFHHMTKLLRDLLPNLDLMWSDEIKTLWFKAINLIEEREKTNAQ